MKLSHPPVLILLDVLFVYLFILILNTSSRSIEIIPPPDKLFDNAKLLTIQNEKYYEYDLRLKKLINFELPQKYNKFIDCGKQKQCQEATNKFGKNQEFFMILPSYLYEEISKVSMLGLSEKTCKKLKFYITDKGLLNKEEIMDKNKCLAKIVGFKENF